MANQQGLSLFLAYISQVRTGLNAHTYWSKSISKEVVGNRRI